MTKSQIIKAHVADAKNLHKMGWKSSAQKYMKYARDTKSGLFDTDIKHYYGLNAIDC